MYVDTLNTRLSQLPRSQVARLGRSSDFACEHEVAPLDLDLIWMCRTTIYLLNHSSCSQCEF
jgi:hypothetical protein